MQNLSRVIPLLTLALSVLPHAELFAGDLQKNLNALPLLEEKASPPQTDWLIDPSSFRADVYRTEKPSELVLDNGLIQRTFRIAPNGATVGLDCLITGESLIRGVKPEAIVSLNGTSYDVGGLTGQPNYAYLLPEWLDKMEADPAALRLVDFRVGKPQARLEWKKVRRHAPNVEWPPKGVHLQMDYALPADASAAIATDKLRNTLWQEDFKEHSESWSVSASPLHKRTSFENEGKIGEIYALSGTHCFAQRALPQTAEVVEATIHPGTDTGVSWGPGLAIVFANRVIKVNLRLGDRGDHGHFELRDNGTEALRSVRAFASEDGGLDVAAAYRLRARIEGTNLIWEAAQATENRDDFQLLFKVDIRNIGKPTAVRVGKLDRQGGSSDEQAYPGELGRCRIEQVRVLGAVDTVKLAAFEKKNDAAGSVVVSVHYELYDGIPAMSKWITVTNHTEAKVTVNKFASEVLAIVEQSNWVEKREAVALPRPDCLHVETDFAFGGFNHENANHHVVHWETDPQFATQVNYLKQMPCLLKVQPTYGPEQDVLPGETFTSCRAFELVYDSTERERRGLALRRMYRTVAPWVTENPLMHHMKVADPAAVRRAIDDAAEVGFEMIILSFGSGFDMDNEDPAYLKTWKEVADYAEEKGIEIGSYSLLSSRSAPAGNMIVPPAGKRCTHGQCPALTSQWGQDYFARLRAFYEKTGFDLLEHDGSYPGDVDVTPRPPLQKGEADSRWAQWKCITEYYQWLRARGVYLNVPDYYFLSGANKCGMGYREVNWSLPREMQVIHTRQNIFDGTWQKTPSMGWMFVPLSQYHGGGDAATIEPLHEHLDHYERMLMSNLALGVQACYRGPRLFDTPKTKDMVKHCVEWFKEHRDILESDVIHGRRADGRDVDWMLHVNPQLKQKGMLVVFNPTSKPISKQLNVNLYYTGLKEVAHVRTGKENSKSIPLARDYSIELPVTIPAGGMTWFVIE